MIKVWDLQQSTLNHRHGKGGFINKKKIERKKHQGKKIREGLGSPSKPMKQTNILKPLHYASEQGCTHGFPSSRVLCRTVPPSSVWESKKCVIHAKGGRQGGRSPSPARAAGDRGTQWQPLGRGGRERPSTIQHCSGRWEEAKCFASFQKKGIKITK